RDRGAFILALVRGGRAGTASVDVRMAADGRLVRVTVVDLTDDLNLLALLFSEPQGLLGPGDAPDRSDGRITINARGVIVDADETAHRLLRRTQPLVDTSMLELLHEQDREEAVLTVAALGDAGDGFAQRRVRLAVGDGWRWFGVVVALREEVGAFACSIVDVHDEVTAVEALRESEERFRSLAASIPLGVFHLDTDGAVRYANDEFARITGLAPGDADTTRIVSPEDADRIAAALQAFAVSGEDLDITHGIRRASDDDARQIRVLARAIRDTTGRAVEVVGSIEDVTDRFRQEQKLVHDATFDALTGLRNRAAFLRAAEERLRRRPVGREIAVLFLDLDGFKALNDSSGHRTGDLVLAAIASRLQVSVRASDLVGRIGGDEFVVVTDVEGGPDGVLALAHRLARDIAEPLDVGPTALRIRASVGVAVSRPDDLDFDVLLRAADLAMYDAKSRAPGSVRMIDDGIRRLGERRITLESDLAGAAQRGELRLEYQPVVGVGDHRTTGAEALLRWEHPVLGRVSPAEFIPIAEAIGAIHELGDWVVHRALLDLRRIRSTDPSFADFIVGVNLSARQLGAAGLPERILRALADHGFAPADLVVELTETVLMDSTADAEAHIRALADAGVAVTLDDFGTGYSSIDYLTRLPASGLKLDTNFIRRLPESARACAVAEGLGVLCRQLGIDLIAEGVETAEHLDLVSGLGATHVQGYLLSPPRPVDELLSLLLQEPDLTRRSGSPVRATAPAD
ncbi:MAG: EAL domain-containing protein, partial [Acidimicrobiales bacterium]|nr:EAL domain-containing protein [Acidimicrobiales bacterium]